MTKQEYKAVQSAQRRAEKREIKLIHLLINYRSNTGERYPKGYIGAINQVPVQWPEFKLYAFWLFAGHEWDKWRQPCFSHIRACKAKRICAFEAEDWAF